MGLYGRNASGAWTGYGGTLSPFAQPWVKKTQAGGYDQWVVADVMYRKKDDNSGWQEVWPLLPGDPSGLSIATPYRNNRIEADFAWLAPVTGVAVSQYNIIVYIEETVIYTTTLPSTTLSFTLTNNGAGFGANSGSSMSFSVQSQTAEGVKGNVVTSNRLIISTTPPPAPVFNLTGSINGGNVSYQFNATPDSRLNQFRVQVYLPGVATADYYFGVSDFVASTQSPYNGANVNGGTVYVTVWAQGAGGDSAPVQIALVIPSDILATGYRFSSGHMVFTPNSANGASSVDVYAGPPNQESFVSNVGLGPQYTVPITSWGVNAYYRAMLIPRGPNGTGRRSYLRQIKKLPNPVSFSADDVQTWQVSNWIARDGYAYQGTSVDGEYYGHGFYGDKFRDNLSDSVLGYHLNPTSFQIYMGRTSGGNQSYIGPPYSVPIRVWLHTLGSVGYGGALLGQWGGPDGSGLAFALDESKYVALPAYWARYLIDQTSGWRSIGIHESDGTISKWFDYSNVDVGAFGITHRYWDVDIYHDG